MFPIISNFFDIPEDDVISFIHAQVLLGPFLLLLIEEAGIPLPVPGDVIIAYTGYLVSQNKTQFLPAFMIFFAAILLGSSLLYYLSTIYGQRLVFKAGKYIDLDEEKFKSVEEKFKKYGILVIIFGRHIPGFRVPITIFAGMSGVPYLTFIFSTIISIIFWIIFYLSLGQRLGAKTLGLVHSHHGYYLFAAIPILVIILFGFFKKITGKSKISAS